MSNGASAGESDDVRAELLGLLGDEFRSGGVPNRLLPATGVAPAQLIVPIELDEPNLGNPNLGGRHLRINLYFLPEVDDPPVIQYFVGLPYDMAAGSEATLARFLCYANANLPLAGFEMSESDGVLVFRHTHAVVVQPLDPSIIAWTLSMIRMAIITFGDLIEDVAGGLDLASARARFDAQMDAVLGS